MPWRQWDVTASARALRRRNSQRSVLSIPARPRRGSGADHCHAAQRCGTPGSPNTGAPCADEMRPPTTGRPLHWVLSCSTHRPPYTCLDEPLIAATSAKNTGFSMVCGFVHSFLGGRPLRLWEITKRARQACGYSSAMVIDSTTGAAPTSNRASSYFGGPNLPVALFESAIGSLGIPIKLVFSSPLPSSS